MERGLRHAAAVLAMICMAAGCTGLTGLIWTGTQQQTMYKDLIQQTKRERIIVQRTKPEMDAETEIPKITEIYRNRETFTNRKGDGSPKLPEKKTQNGKTSSMKKAETQTQAAESPKEPVIDFEALQSKNPDIVAWITIPGTAVDYPVLQAKDNDYYLHRDVERKESSAGSIFLDYEDSADFSGLHNILYGHHMKNGSMFRDIVRYKNQDYFDSHREIILYTPKREIHLKAIAAVCTSADAIRRKTDFQSKAEFDSYVAQMIQGAKAAAKETETVGHLYSFVTCSYEFQNARTILYACEVK